MANRIWNKRIATFCISLAIITTATVISSSNSYAIWAGFSASAKGKSLVPAVVRVEAGGTKKRTPDICTGTLIAADWVVTAQHCTNRGEVQGQPYRADQVKIVLDKSAENSKKITIKVINIIRMDGYNQDTGKNDITLLQLKNEVDNVRPIRIADSPIPSGTDAYVYGFGETASGKGNAQNMPRAAEIAVTTASALNQVSQSCNFRDIAGQTYVQSVIGGTARGDSGGPTFEWQNNVPQLFDVTSGGADTNTCRGGTSQHPNTWVGVYNRVDQQSPAWKFLVANIPSLGLSF